MKQNNRIDEILWVVPDPEMTKSSDTTELEATRNNVDENNYDTDGNGRIVGDNGAIVNGDAAQNSNDTATEHDL